MMVWLLIGAGAAAFFFCGMEAALASVDRVRLRIRAMSGDKKAVRMEELLRHPGRLLVVVAVLHAFCRVMVLALFYGTLSRRVGAMESVGLMVGSLPLWALLLEVLPKAVFRVFPYRRLLPFLWLLGRLSVLVSPVVSFVERWAGGRLPGEGWKRVGLPELRAAINRLAASGGITPLQKHMLHSVLSAREVTVKEEVVPLEPSATAAPRTPVAELLDRARDGGIETFFIFPEGKGMESSGFSGPWVVRLREVLLGGACHGQAQNCMKRAPELPPDLPLTDAALLLRAWGADCALVKGQARPCSVSLKGLVARLLLGPSQVPLKQSR